MKTLFAAAFALFLSGSFVTAQVCDPASPRPLGQIEAAKAAIMEGITPAFFDEVTPFMMVGPQIEETFVNSIETNFPGGFVSCQTVVQRIEEPGFVQEIVMFRHGQIINPIFFYISAIDVGGGFEIIQVNFNTTASDVFADLR